jgi:hypothetical protein
MSRRDRRRRSGAPLCDALPVTVASSLPHRVRRPQRTSSVTDPAAVMPLLQPAPDDLLVAEKVLTLVNDVRNDSPQLIMPLDD